MTTQPEALRLAERLERYDAERSGYAKHCHAAAAELRRLHEVNEELLEALRLAADHANWPDIAQRIRAVIAKAERTTT